MNAGKKIKNTYKFSKVDKFIWNCFQLNKTLLIDINNYFQKSAKFSQGLIVNDKYFKNNFH